MGWDNLLGYMLSSLFIQRKVRKGKIFTTVLQNDKSNPAKLISENAYHIFF